MVKLYSIGALTADCYEGAKADAKVVNNTFGTWVDGKFTVGAKGGFMVDTIVVGDDKYLDNVEFEAGKDLRVVNLAKVVGKKIQASPSSIVGTPQVGKYLQADADGKLKAITTKPSASDEIYFVVDEIIDFDGKGVLATIALA